MIPLIEISEPTKQDVSKQQSDEIAVGIDFGTTNSLVSFSRDGKTEIIEMIPSVVSLNNEGKLIVSDLGFGSVKRLLGKGEEDIESLHDEVKSKISLKNGVIRVCIDDKLFSPIEISSAILSHLKKRAEEHLKCNVSKAVISVPAYFDDTSRNDVLTAAKISGINVLRLISEPTAAAFAYGLDNKTKGIYLVYDLGGGTFDVSILNMQMGVFQVLAVGGDNMLGGDDIDYELSKTFKNATSSIKALKEKLSYHDIVDGVTRKKLEEIIRPIIKRTMDITENVILDSGIQIDGIITVGGSTRIPLIKQELSNRFGAPILDDVDPDQVVAIGSAKQAENLTSRCGNLIIDVVPLSLGMEVMGGLNEKMIMRNSPIPTSFTKEFTTYADNQTAMSFHIVQGEREMAKDCRSLAKFELKNIPPMKAGAARVKVVFTIDADGIVSISAREELSKIHQIVSIKPSHGLSREDTIKMLRNAYDNAEKDHHLRLLTETKLEAAKAIKKLEEAIHTASELLSHQEAEDSRIFITELKNVQESEDRELIRTKLQRVLNFSEEFGMKILNESISNKMKGHHIDEVE
ncbi:MAG: Hsp70 family protein [Rickettsiaceae bacterium]|nr:Hsp70 family protein [Rickettsiaceae bacterium]